MDKTMTKSEKLYIESLNDKEKKAYIIARDFLKSSFDLEKSLGYKEYIKKRSLGGLENKMTN